MAEKPGKKKRGGRSSVPKTAAARARQAEEIRRRQERLQRELAAARKQRAAIAAADRADRAKVREGLERAAGKMLLETIAEKRRLAAAGDESARRNAEYWTEKLDSAVTDPAQRSQRQAS